MKLALGALLVAQLLSGLRQDDRRAVPSEAAQAASEKLIRDVFKAEYAKTAAADKQDLARKLIQQEAGTTDDPTSQYVLLREAKDLAAQAGNAEISLQAVRGLSKLFKVDEVALKNAVLAIVSKTAKTPADLTILARIHLKQAEDAAKNDDYDGAVQGANSAASFARRAKELILAVYAERRAKEFGDTKSSYEKVKASKETLAKDPTDPDANLALGRFRCFVKGDWDAGIPLLAKGSDAGLKSLAAQETAKPTKAGEQAALGDVWWDLAEKETGIVKDNLQGRAAYWYGEALEGLTGLTKSRVEKRLAEVADKKGGTWVDVTDPALFGMTGQSCTPIEIAPQFGKEDAKTLKPFPPGEFDGAQVRIHFGADKLVTAGFTLERERRKFSLSRSEVTRGSGHSLYSAHFDEVDRKWIGDWQVECARKDDFLLTVLIVGGAYLVYVDGEEKLQIPTSETKLTTLSLQAFNEAVKFDQIKLRKKKK